MREITVALAGNPNAGKTTVFNALTGARQHVGNYPGVTVEKKEGTVARGGVSFRIVDLPGAYSLSANSPEEAVARNFLVNDSPGPGARPDVVVQVADASNMERNLYLATQIMELGLPLVIALNMSDVAKAKGIEYDLAQLQSLLRVPVVPTVGSRRQGMDELLDAVAKQADLPRPDYPGIAYPQDLENAVGAVDALLSGSDREWARRFPDRWLAARLLENDAEIMNKTSDGALPGAVADLRRAFEKEHGDLPEVRIAESRYGWISGLCAETVRMTPEANFDVSDRVDSIVLHRLLGLPIFLFLMYAMFQLVFTLGEPPMGWIEEGFSLLGDAVSGLWPDGSESPLRDLLVDGVIGGVGGVLVFLPNIVLLFLAIAFLEGTGYMARAAFIMDRLMHKIGLHGKSFIPMLLGFGCTVPAIMATRTLENRRDRLVTILVLPLMSCGARLPVYALIIPAFFPDRLHAWMLWLIYLIGIAFAVAGAKLLRATAFRGPGVPFVMELPPYRMPTPRSVLLLMWDRAREYVKKAGTVILGVSILLWAVSTYPKLPGDAPGYPDSAAVQAYTVSGRIGRFLEPVLEPIGFDWRIGTAIIGSFAAKEVFVAQLGIAYSEDDADENSETLREKLRAHYSPLQGFCMMIYALLSLPCVATIAVTRREAGGWGYALAMMAGLTLLAYAATFAVFRIGSALGIGV